MEELFGWNTTEIFYYIISVPPGEFLFFHFLVSLFFLVPLFYVANCQ